MKRVLSLLWIAAVVGGCTSDPIESDEPTAIVNRCCAEARARVASVKDVESTQFGARCNACRPGESKKACATAAKKILHTVKGAYGDMSTPSACTTMLDSLGEHGIE